MLSKGSDNKSLSRIEEYLFFSTTKDTKYTKKTEFEVKCLCFFDIHHYLKHLQRFRSEFRTEKLCVTLRKLCVTLRLKSARQNYQNILGIGIDLTTE